MKYFYNISLQSLYCYQLCKHFFLYKGPARLEHRVTASEISLTWETPVLPKDFPQPLQYQLILERNDGNRRRGKVVENKTSKFKCDFQNLWSSTAYTVKCFTLIDGKRKYAPVVIKTKTKFGNY